MRPEMITDLRDHRRNSLRVLVQLNGHHQNAHMNEWTTTKARAGVLQKDIISHASGANGVNVVDESHFGKKEANTKKKEKRRNVRQRWNDGNNDEKVPPALTYNQTISRIMLSHCVTERSIKCLKSDIQYLNVFNHKDGWALCVVNKAENGVARGGPPYNRTIS